ncbi:MAG: HEAT repeat domain-containing protein [Myxococcota bacterium]
MAAGISLGTRTSRKGWLTSLGLLVGGALRASTAHAAPAFVAPTPEQPSFAVGTDAQGVLRAKACAAQPCDVNGGTALGVPNELAANVARARIELVGIGGQRRAVVVSVPGGRDGRAFQAVVVMAAGRAPEVVFHDWTGLTEGTDGVRQGKVVTISEPDENGARRIVVGVSREDLELCGRPAVLAPELLNPKDLRFHAAKVQRLSPSEREQAPTLTATRVAEGTPPASEGVLRALGASSATGSFSGLTDGKLDTAWTENRGGTGRGEFVVMRAPPELPLTGFELSVPGGAARSHVPRELWLATKQQLFHVTLPDDAAKTAGARYRVTLPKPVQTDCVALVLESAFEERPDAAVSVNELRATTELESADPKALVGALAGGAERARAAGALLRALGTPGFEAIAQGFESLDEGGRRVALDAVDAAPCEQSATVYVSALTSSFEAQRLHARDRLRRCGRASAELLSTRLSNAKVGEAEPLAEELALVAPERAVDAIFERLAKPQARERRALRVILARAAAQPAARERVLARLSDANAPLPPLLELLRALGPRSPSFMPASGAALARVSADGSFRSRYLSLEPAAGLAASDPAARSVLDRALADPNDARLRVRALEVMPRDAAAANAFVAALSDKEVRVREAAAHAVADARVAAAAPQLGAVLANDDWPLARRAAGDALAALPPEPNGDAALSKALGDSAWMVRAAAATALGARGVKRAAPELRELLADKEQHYEVRRAAATGVAALCDADSLDALTKAAQKLADPLASVEERAVGESALRGLARIAPRDLEQRLKPLQSSPMAPAAKRALSDAAQSKACAR